MELKTYVMWILFDRYELVLFCKIFKIVKNIINYKIVDKPIGMERVLLKGKLEIWHVLMDIYRKWIFILRLSEYF